MSMFTRKTSPADRMPFGTALGRSEWSVSELSPPGLMISFLCTTPARAAHPRSALTSPRATCANGARAYIPGECVRSQISRSLCPEMGASPGDGRPRSRRSSPGISRGAWPAQVRGKMPGGAREERELCRPGASAEREWKKVKDRGVPKDRRMIHRPFRSGHCHARSS